MAADNPRPYIYLYRDYLSANITAVNSVLIYSQAAERLLTFKLQGTDSSIGGGGCRQHRMGKPGSQRQACTINANTVVLQRETEVNTSDWDKVKTQWEVKATKGGIGKAAD